MKKLIVCALLASCVSFTSAQTVSDSCMKVTALMNVGDTDAKKEGHVTLLQLFLIQHFKLNAGQYLTGKYDKKTETLVKRLQKQAGFRQVGNFGPQTREYMRGLCLNYHPELSGRSVQTQATAQPVQQVTKNIPLSTETINALRDDFRTVIGASAFAGLLVSHYTYFGAVPIHTAPANVEDVLPQLVRNIYQKQREQSTAQNGDVEKAIADLLKSIVGMTYISDASGKSMCLGLTLHPSTAEGLEKEFNAKRSDYVCPLVANMANRNIVIGVSAQKMQEVSAKVEESRKKVLAARAVQDIKQVQIALELAYDGAGKYPPRTTPVSTTTLSELATYLSNYTKIDLQYVTDPEGKKYCLGKYVDPLPSGAVSSVCTNGLSLPATVNYVVQP